MFLSKSQLQASSLGRAVMPFDPGRAGCYFPADLITSFHLNHYLLDVLK